MTRYKSTFRFSLRLVALSMVLLASCVGIVPLQSFVRSNGNYMYFVKPLRFRGSVRWEYVTIDWTIHASRNSIEKVVMNYSVFSRQPYRRVDSVRLSNAEYGGRWVKGGECLFVEPTARGYQSRWSTDFPAEALLNLFASKRLFVELRGTKRITCESGWREGRKIEKLEAELLPLLP